MTNETVVEQTQKTPEVNPTNDVKRKTISYAKWGYIFLIPFFLVYLVFTLYPQLTTIFYSFRDIRKETAGSAGLAQDFGWANNYGALFQKNANGNIPILKALGNTMIMWIIGVVPQMLIALILALLFTSTRLNLKGQRFFKTTFYLPNVIMASAFAMLFWLVFSDIGPINLLFFPKDSPFLFLSNKWVARILVGSLNFLMWFGNTTLVLMAGIQGIDESLFESARMDGASSTRVLFDITLPLLKPILIYTVITSLIGGIQMFDVPQLLTNGKGGPNESTRTLIMVLNDYMYDKNYGLAGAVAVILFIISGGLSFIVFKAINRKD